MQKEKNSQERGGNTNSRVEGLDRGMGVGRNGGQERMHIGWSCALLSVRLFVYTGMSIAYRSQFKPIFTKLHHLVEFVISKKPIVFELKMSTSAKGQRLR